MIMRWKEATTEPMASSQIPACLSTSGPGVYGDLGPRSRRVDEIYRTWRAQQGSRPAPLDGLGNVKGGMLLEASIFSRTGDAATVPLDTRLCDSAG